MVQTKHLMPNQDPFERLKNFNEVALGLELTDALNEAARCYQCKNARCVAGCPVQVPIPQFIKKIRELDFVGSLKVIKTTNNLPSICGRVCPQENQCQEHCIATKKGGPIQIGMLERFVSDYVRNKGIEEKSQLPPAIDNKVAVIGSGPSGLTCAADLAILGHKVRLFEALHEFGGVLVYGIPEFRLPKGIVNDEIKKISELGVIMEKDVLVGRTITIDDLLREFNSVYIASGAGTPNFMGIPGENLLGVYSANEFLTRVNLMKAMVFPEADTPVSIGDIVCVIGGGNVAMDAARIALRLGAQEVTIVYRRSIQEMPARLEERIHAEEEGIIFAELVNPLELIGDERGFVRKMKAVKMQLREPDPSGRRSVTPIVGSEFEFAADTVIFAIGQEPNPLISMTTPQLQVDSRKKTIKINPETGRTSIPNVYAGGDVATGAATVILAMGAGKIAAKAIHEDYLKRTGKFEQPTVEKKGDE